VNLIIANTYPHRAYGKSVRVAEKARSRTFRPSGPAYRPAPPTQTYYELLDHPKLHPQLLSLERPDARGGKDRVRPPAERARRRGKCRGWRTRERVRGSRASRGALLLSPNVSGLS